MNIHFPVFKARFRAFWLGMAARRKSELSAFDWTLRGRSKGGLSLLSETAFEYQRGHWELHGFVVRTVFAFSPAAGGHQLITGGVT